MRERRVGILVDRLLEQRDDAFRPIGPGLEPGKAHQRSEVARVMLQRLLEVGARLLEVAVARGEGAQIIGCVRSARLDLEGLLEGRPRRLDVAHVGLH